ncbi:MAG: hypothetical protein ACR2PQ_05815, partial [Myxococcota bacterium]
MSMLQRFLTRSLVVILTILLPVAATTLGEPLSGIADEDLPALEALSLYPEDLRRSILEASTEAHVLGELSARQERSRESFARLLEPYEQETQEQLFQLTRYPTLVAEIVEGGPKNPDELETIAARYPEDALDAALAAGGQNWKLVSRAHALLSSEQTAFGRLVGDLPDEKQSAFLALIDTPEVLALMSENTEMTVLLGDAYERDPDGVRLAFDDLQQVVAERNAEEARDFAELVESDPELQEEVDASYREYEEEFVEPAAPAPVQQVNVHVNIVRPYSYWVGVPPWVRADYSYYDPWMHWYPRPYWRRSGLWFGPRFTVVHRVPHFGFYGWYFNRPVHHHRYPRLSNHFLRHHDRHGYGHHYDRGHRGHHYDRGHRGYHRGRHHRRFGPGGHAVGRFVRNAEREMPRGFLRAGKDRPQRLAEYGRLKNEMRRDYRKSGKWRGHGKAKKHNRDDLDRFVAKRPGDFPGLTQLAAAEKGERHTKPKKGKNADLRKGDGKWKGTRFVDSGKGPERVTKPKKQPETRAERKDRKDAEKLAKQQRRTDEKQAREQARTSEKLAKQERQTDKKQAREQKRTFEKQTKQQRQTDEKRAREQKRTSEKLAKQQRQTDKKQAREQKRTSEKVAKQQRQTGEKQAREQKRTSEKLARQQRAAEQQAKKRQQASDRQAKQRQRAAEQQEKKRQQASAQQAKQRQRAAEQQAKERQRSNEQQAKQRQRASEQQAKQQRRASEKQAKAQKRAGKK